jgi:hypothetical protein
MASFLSSVARGIDPDDVAASVARQRLISCSTDHPVAPVRDCVQVARAVGLPMAEIQRTTGIPRQTLYRHAEIDDANLREPPRQQVAIEVLTIAASETGRMPVALLARRGGLALTVVHSVAIELAEAGQCSIARDDDYIGLEIEATEATRQLLREHFDDLFLQRPDAFSVYLRVQEEDRDRVAQAAARILPALEHVLIDPLTAPSLMIGPELALPVYAPTIRRALMIASDVWDAVTDGAGIEPSPAQIANVIPPGGQRPGAEPSLVLDAFLERIIDAGGQGAEALRTLRAEYQGGASERELAGRCVTAAALALRRAVGNEKDPRPIRTGDDAFVEWQPAQSVATPQEAVPVKKAAVAALDLAIERIGPMPGGRLGSFRRPGGPPNIVETPEPSTNELVRMAEFAGTAVGAASAIGALHAQVAMRRVIAGTEID